MTGMKCSFFEKKEPKKLSPLWRVSGGAHGVPERIKSFFASFCSQKEVLASVLS
jgi:hypothetical protein